MTRDPAARLWPWDLLLAALLLIGLAQLSGAQFEGDPFGHFDQATRRSGDLHYLVFDTWTRPLPNLLYWPGRWLGAYWVFVLPVALTLLAAACVRATATRLLPAPAPQLMVLLFVLQHPVLESGYLTMTEAPFVLVTAAALAAFYAGRLRSACLLAGLLPLCRTEGLLMAAALALTLVLARRGRGAVLALLLAALPFALWLGAGWWLSGEPGWYFRFNSYRNVAALRSGPWPWLLANNAITVAPRLLPGPVLPLCVLGLVELRRWLRQNGVAVGPLLVPVVIQAGVLSALHTGPGAWGDFYAAALPRMYAVLAPTLALCAGSGLLGAAAQPRSRRVTLACVATLALLAAGFPHWVLERAGPDRIDAALYARTSSGPGAGALWSAVLAQVRQDPGHLRYLVLPLTALGLWWCARRGWLRGLLQRLDPAAGPWRAALLTGALLLFLPWTFASGPSRLGAPRAAGIAHHECLRAFGRRYQERWAAERRPVLQQQAHNLGGYCGIDEGAPGAPDLTWRWPAQFAGAQEAAAPGTLFLAGFAPKDSPRLQELAAPFRDPQRFTDQSFALTVGGAAWTAVVFERR